MAQLSQIIAYCDQRLNSAAFKDYCPNGLQVEACSEVQRLVTGVTASQQLIRAAMDYHADLILVHHGYFWQKEPLALTGIKAKRIQALFQNQISLAAYHLPLDAHPELGNNRLWGEKLGLQAIEAADEDHFLWRGRGFSLAHLLHRIEQLNDRRPLHIAAGPEEVRSVYWCTGGASFLLEKAAQMGADVYITGEPSESSYHLAWEYGIHFIAAGHHATERYGVQALGQELAQRFGLKHHYIELDNPI